MAKWVNPVCKVIGDAKKWHHITFFLNAIIWTLRKKLKRKGNRDCWVWCDWKPTWVILDYRVPDQGERYPISLSRKPETSLPVFFFQTKWHFLEPCSKLIVNDYWMNKPRTVHW
jgi:hypothetical protein